MRSDRHTRNLRRFIALSDAAIHGRVVPFDIGSRPTEAGARQIGDDGFHNRLRRGKHEGPIAFDAIDASWRQAAKDHHFLTGQFFAAAAAAVANGHLFDRGQQLVGLCDLVLGVHEQDKARLLVEVGRADERQADFALRQLEKLIERQPNGLFNRLEGVLSRFKNLTDQRLHLRILSDAAQGRLLKASPTAARRQSAQPRV